jgi:GT2 family glycosyltransferase
VDGASSATMRTSIVIATYNRLSLLTDLLEDLTRQTNAGPFDVTVVDDGSATPVADHIGARRWPFPLQVITQSNAGQAHARHRGILASSGEIIVIVDDDMQLPAAFLAEHRALHEQGAEVVMGMLKPADDLGKKPVFERFHAAQLESFVNSVRTGAVLSGSELCTGNVSLRRADYLRVGGFDLSLQRSEDRDLGIRLSKAGVRMAFSETAFTKHRSDHTDRGVWKRRAFSYGVSDHRIARKHPADLTQDPWHYLELVSPLSRPLLISAVLSQPWGKLLAELALRTSEQVDRAGLTRLALQGTTLSFGLEYFRGVRSQYRSSVHALADLSRYALQRWRQGG